ncbi:MAG: hypothetical protein GTO02_00225 [Candidatus Dadabacteria bacterium]|nr:hypothetical protein [Candidatus Dadabacteria bacterium]
MAVKYYRLYCEICGHNIVTDGSDVNLVEYKRSKIQKEIPKLDPTTGKLVESTWLTLPKKYKCPKCGRLISARKLKEPELEDKTKNDDDKNFNPRSQGGFERL